MKSLDNRGFSLAEAVIGMAVLLIGSLAMMQLMSVQSNEMARLRQKLKILDLGREVREALNNSTVCSFNLSSNGAVTLDATSIPDVNAGTPLTTALLNPTVIHEGSTLTSRKLAEAGQALDGGVDPKVVSISVSNWVQRAADYYVGDLTINLSSGFGPLAPMVVRGLNFRTTGPVSAKVIKSCSTGSLPLSVSEWLGIAVPLGTYKYSYLGSKAPVMLIGYTTLMAAGSTVCLLQAQWHDSSGAVLKSWQTLAGSNPAGGPDGKAFINSGFPIAVTFIPDSTQISFRSLGACSGGATLYLHTLMEQ